MIKINGNRLVFSFMLVMSAAILSASAADGELTKSEADTVLARIRVRYEPVFTRYRGVESTREITLREYDSKAGKLLATSRIRLVRRDYFYDLPEITVLSYEKDGKQMNPTDYKPRREEPLFPVFDRSGGSHYRTEINGTITIDGVKCYRVQVTPLDATARHFRGNLYYRADNLDQVLAEGSGAKLALGVKSFWMKMNMRTVQGVPAISGGTMTILVDVALLYPNRKFVSEIKASNIRIIPL
ncbi:MAG TPA: hypothetical protein PLA65_12200 [Spirochaetota bacterium]|nr:hypothetical protein [Spirochaetota bacterium]HOD15141.1 hypothetical protein [Spirochaetota bacterium]HPG51957.1 hypothetical protein [Spirochaetota bacterium]HPN12819.1 hypothetical protein [Spirochaetota bacterium]